MNFKNYYEHNETYHTEMNDRLRKIIALVGELKPHQLLDVGCGAGVLLRELQKAYPSIQYHGVDVYEQPDAPYTYQSADITDGLPHKTGQFDCVILGEVIEHVPNPDDLLTEIHRVLKPGGHLIISTPNMVSWANRLLVPLGIQPLFTETSSEVNLGRRLKALGQGGKVQGHLKIFTHRSLAEILERTHFRLTKRYGTPFFFPFPLSLVDRLCARIIPLASDLLYVAKKSGKRSL